MMGPLTKQDPDRLDRWIGQAGHHWRDHLPRRYRELDKAGELPQALLRAAELTAREMDQLLDSGFDPDQAWEMVRNEYLFLPPEPEKPRKGQGRGRAHRMTKDLQEQAALIDRAFSSEE